MAHSHKNKRYSITDSQGLAALWKTHSAYSFQNFESLKSLFLSVQTTEQVVKTTCALHNWLIKTSLPIHPYIQRDMLDIEEWEEGRVKPDTAIQYPHTGLEEIPRRAVNNYWRAVGEVRTYYADRFVTTDIVPWQWNNVCCDLLID